MVGFRLVIAAPRIYRARATCPAWADRPRRRFADATTDDIVDGEERGAWLTSASQFEHFDAWLIPDPNAISPTQTKATVSITGPVVLQTFGAGLSEGTNHGTPSNSECLTHRS